MTEPLSRPANERTGEASTPSTPVAPDYLRFSDSVSYALKFIKLSSLIAIVKRPSADDAMLCPEGAQRQPQTLAGHEQHRRPHRRRAHAQVLALTSPMESRRDLQLTNYSSQARALAAQPLYLIPVHNWRTGLRSISDVVQQRKSCKLEAKRGTRLRAIDKVCKATLCMHIAACQLTTANCTRNNHIPTSLSLPIADDFLDAVHANLTVRAEPSSRSFTGPSSKVWTTGHSDLSQRRTDSW